MSELDKNFYDVRIGSFRQHDAPISFIVGRYNDEGTARLCGLLGKKGLDELLSTESESVIHRQLARLVAGHLILSDESFCQKDYTEDSVLPSYLVYMREAAANGLDEAEQFVFSSVCNERSACSFSQDFTVTQT